MASIHQITRDLDSMEAVFVKCIENSENSPLIKGLKSDNHSRVSSIFTWQNNLLKFYLENNIDKAIDYGGELIEEVGPLLPSHSQQDLHFSVGTAMSLKCQDLEGAIDLYAKAVGSADDNDQMMGIIHNNLGITHFFKFVELSQEIQNPANISPEKVQPVIENANLAISNLKKSVKHFERFDLRLSAFNTESVEGQEEVKLIDIETKLFVDEFFNTEISEVMPADFKSYDLMQNAKNQAFLKQAFHNPPVILPI